MRLIAFIRNTVFLHPPFLHTNLCLLTHCAGPIVRIAPNELHIKDVEYYDTLYSLGVKRNKVPYMIDIFGTPLAS